MPYHQPANCLLVRKVSLPCTNPALETGKDSRPQASGRLDAVNIDMHNRVRMVVGSFLPKNLGIHWRLCEEWFWDTLVDADAAPFFRIFNPETQAKRFDPDGDYVRRWAPALSAPPIGDLKESRQAALDAYAEI